MFSLSHLQSFELLQLDPVSEHLWGPFFTTPLMWGCYCNSSGPCPSPVFLRNAIPHPTHSSWSIYSPWIVGMMRWSRGWVSASQFINRFTQQWRYILSILKSVGWFRGYLVWTETYPRFSALPWCLIILCVCQGAPFLQRQKHFNSIILVVENVCSPKGPELALSTSV